MTTAAPFASPLKNVTTIVDKNQLVFTRYAVTKDGTVSAGQVKEKLAEDIEKCDFRIPEKNNGIDRKSVV